MDAELELMLHQYHFIKNQIEPLTTQLEPLVEQERSLRSQIISKAFPLLCDDCRTHMDATGTAEHHPSACGCGKEGVNYLDLPAGWRLRGTVVIDRKVDEAALGAVEVELQKMLINPDTVFRWKPEVQTKAYKDLPVEIRHIVDQALIIKPGSPKLEFVAPKEK